MARVSQGPRRRRRRTRRARRGRRRRAGGGGGGGGGGARRRAGGAAGAPPARSRRQARQAARRGQARPRRRGEAQGPGHRSDRPQPGDRRRSRRFPRSPSSRGTRTARWLAYAVSSTDAAKDGAFARKHGRRRGADAARRASGHYKSLAFDEAGKQLAFLSDQAEYDKPVSPYRLYLLEGGATRPAAELVSAATRGHAAGHGRRATAAPRFSEDGARLYLGDRAAAAPRRRIRTRDARRRCRSTSGATRTR